MQRQPRRDDEVTFRVKKRWVLSFIIAALLLFGETGRELFRRLLAFLMKDQ